MGQRIDRFVLLKHCATGEILPVTAVIGNPFFTTGVRSPNSSDIGKSGEYGGIMSYIITASSKCHPKQHLGQAYGQNLLVLGEKYDLIQVNPGPPQISGGQPAKVVLTTAPSCGGRLPQTPNIQMAKNRRSSRKGRDISNRFRNYEGNEKGTSKLPLFVFYLIGAGALYYVAIKNKWLEE